MKTSATVKEGQKLQAAIIAGDGRQWVVEGRHGTLYHVQRVRDNVWSCDCQAGRKGLLCRHVTSVIKQLTADAHMARVAVWTHEEDAQRQHRPVLEMELAGGRSFWVTYTWPGWVPRREGKILKVNDGTPGRADVYYQKGKFIWRQSCQIGG